MARHHEGSENGTFSIGWQGVEDVVRDTKFDAEFQNAFLESAAEEFDWNTNVKLADVFKFLHAWVELQVLAIQSLYMRPEVLSEADQLAGKYEAFGKELREKLSLH